ncbi:MAG: hypothetical protein HY512_01010 [Candidatus Aenigmarchaeota archaeon]|nr:hypothetical protein [Candidatus Aenigmarchaeota archaeon]
MKSSIAVIIIVILFAAAFGGVYLYFNQAKTTPGIDIKPQAVEYVDSERGYAITSPAGWTRDIATARKLGEGLRVMFIGPQFGDFITNVNVNQGFFGEGGINWKNPPGPNFRNYKVVSYSNLTVGNLTAKELVYTADINNYKAKSKFVYITKSGNFTQSENFYLVAYTALEENYDQFLPLAQKSVESFRLLPSAI